MKYGPSIVTNGCILALDAADRNSYPGSGNTWYDLSGNGNHGTLNNTTFSNSNNGYFIFDGSTSYVDCGSIDSIEGISGLTFSSWGYFNSFTNSYLLNTWYSAVALISYQFAMLVDGVNWASAYGVTQDTSLQTWILVTGVFDGDKCTLYWNDQIKATSSIVSGLTPSTNVNLVIGRKSAAAPLGYLNGQISNALIYNRALSASEIQQNYNTTKSRFGL